MGQVISFENYLPPARFDSLPWAQARIDEASTAAGPWTTIDTIALSPLDADPAHPQSRSFTTQNGSAGDGLWYRVIFLDADGDTSQPTAPVQNAPSSTGRDLCTLNDVLGYVPGYTPQPDTNATLERLITAESRSIHQETGREFRAIVPAMPTRLFEFCSTDAANRMIRIGDCAQITSLRLLDQNGVALVAGPLAVDQYALLPRVREEWEPIRRVKLLAAGPAPTPGQLLEVTGVWGFPSVPQDIVQACAKRVILRYLSDVAAAGTDFADAIADSEFSIGGLLRSSQEAIANYGNPEVA